MNSTPKRIRFSIDEETKMCNFLYDELKKRNGAAKTPCGLQIWEQFRAANITTRTTISLQTHFKIMKNDGLDNVFPNISGDVYLTLIKEYGIKLNPGIKYFLELHNHYSMTVDKDEHITSFENNFPNQDAKRPASAARDESNNRAKPKVEDDSDDDDWLIAKKSRIEPRNAAASKKSEVPHQSSVQASKSSIERRSSYTTTRETNERQEAANKRVPKVEDDSDDDDWLIAKKSRIEPRNAAVSKKLEVPHQSSVQRVQVDSDASEERHQSSIERRSSYTTTRETNERQEAANEISPDLFEELNSPEVINVRDTSESSEGQGSIDIFDAAREMDEKLSQESSNESEQLPDTLPPRRTVSQDSKDGAETSLGYSTEWTPWLKLLAWKQESLEDESKSNVKSSVEYVFEVAKARFGFAPPLKATREDDIYEELISTYSSDPVSMIFPCEAASTEYKVSLSKRETVMSELQSLLRPKPISECVFHVVHLIILMELYTAMYAPDEAGYFSRMEKVKEFVNEVVQSHKA